MADLYPHLFAPADQLVLVLFDLEDFGEGCILQRLEGREVR